jgi:CRISPR/Cas system-associated protein endoribonuclease Cas2
MVTQKQFDEIKNQMCTQKQFDELKQLIGDLANKVDSLPK